MHPPSLPNDLLSQGPHFISRWGHFSPGPDFSCWSQTCHFWSFRPHQLLHSSGTSLLFCWTSSLPSTPLPSNCPKVETSLTYISVLTTPWPQLLPSDLLPNPCIVMLEVQKTLFSAAKTRDILEEPDLPLLRK